MQTKVLGRTGLSIPTIGLGGAFLGLPTVEDMRRQYEGGNPERRSYCDTNLGIQTVQAAVNAGALLVDTAPLYLGGESENIIGRALAGPDGVSVTITTKAGPTWPGDDYDWSYRATIRAVEASLERLGMSTLPIVYIHDPMGQDMKFVMGFDGAFAALRSMQKQGVIRWIGVAANDPETNADYIETGEFDAAVVPGAWSIINRIAESRIFPAAARWNTGLVVATPIERGLLVTGPEEREYLFRDFPQDCLDHVSRMKDFCREWGIPLGAAALQWCVRRPEVAAVIPGARTPGEAIGNTRNGEVVIPEEFWTAFEPLIKHFDLMRG